LLAVGNPSPAGESLPNLPFAEAEARLVARLYAHSELLVGSQATKDRFLSSCSKAEVVHYAGHAKSNSELPERAALFLAEAGRNDGVLRAGEIEKVDLHNVRLVVLAACGSNVGRFSVQGPLSVAGAFLKAGAKNVLATLEDQEDGDAEAILTRFHEELMRGSGIPDALRDAQIAMLRGGGLRASPWRWAGYQIVT
jgi:CHAT domain-containing protein